MRAACSHLFHTTRRIDFSICSHIYFLFFNHFPFFWMLSFWREIRMNLSFIDHIYTHIYTQSFNDFLFIRSEKWFLRLRSNGHTICIKLKHPFVMHMQKLYFKLDQKLPSSSLLISFFSIFFVFVSFVSIHTNTHTHTRNIHCSKENIY